MTGCRSSAFRRSMTWPPGNVSECGRLDDPPAPRKGALARFHAWNRADDGPRGSHRRSASSGVILHGLDPEGDRLLRRRRVVVFLSGFTFGWISLPRLHQHGWWWIQRRAIWRAAVIYGVLMLTTLVVGLLAWSISRTSFVTRLPLTVTSRSMMLEVLIETASLREPVWGASILVVYCTVFPALPLMLALAQRSARAAFAVSAAAYAASQLVPALNTADLGFNPLAWQFLIVIECSSERRPARAESGLPPVGGASSQRLVSCWSVSLPRSDPGFFLAQSGATP